MAKRRFQRRREDTGKNLRINERIRRSPVRLIGADNEQIGVTETPEALRRAREANLDLVEVAPNADPPVCRIMDYGKWKYQQKKKEQKAKVHAKQSELKEVRLRPGTDEHDLDIKINKAEEFIDEGHKVQFTILFRGRQMAHREIGFGLCRRISDRFADKAHVEVAPRMQGRRMTMIVVPGAAKTAKPKEAGAGPQVSVARRPVTPAPGPQDQPQAVQASQP